MDKNTYLTERGELLKVLKHAGMQSPASRFPAVRDTLDELHDSRARQEQIAQMRDEIETVRNA